jgi:CRISPR-associated endonuclease/helicase Cas3
MEERSCTPAIIIATVDMAGSKLLFSGYGDGRWKRSFHAGLLGQDVLYVHDEAHLSSAFEVLIREIAKLQERCGPWKPFSVMNMSATPGACSDSVISITDADRALPAVSQRLNADKRLCLHVLNEKEELEKTIADCAFIHEAHSRSVLIYVRTPESAAKVAGHLRQRAGPERVIVLTSAFSCTTIRPNPSLMLFSQHVSRGGRC